MSTGGGPGAAWGRMGVTVPADTGGGAFKNAGNMARCPVTGIMWQRTGGLGAGTETRGGVLPGKSFSQFFGEQGGTATGRPACWPWWGGPGSPGFLERGGQGPEFKVREASPRCASRKAPPCPRSSAAPPLWSGVGVAGMWPVAGLPRAWGVAPATRALQGGARRRLRQLWLQTGQAPLLPRAQGAGCFGIRCLGRNRCSRQRLGEVGAQRRSHALGGKEKAVGKAAVVTSQKAFTSMGMLPTPLQTLACAFTSRSPPFSDRPHRSLRSAPISAAPGPAQGRR